MRYAGIALVGLVAGCAATTGPRLTTSGMPVCPRAVVIVVDGAGGTAVTSNSLDRVVREERLPLAVVAYDWSHGWGRFISDQVNDDHLDRQGEELARYIQKVRCDRPNLPVHLLVYSAGSGVAVRVGQHLPPDTLDKVVLLAPAVSYQADLRPLLRASRRGVDVYTSVRDRFYLGVGTGIVGPTGGGPSPAAGRYGFDPVVCGPDDAALYRARLRHFPWGPEYCWTGNVGQHGGGHEPVFLATFVVPAFLDATR